MVCVCVAQMFGGSMASICLEKMSKIDISREETDVSRVLSGDRGLSPDNLTNNDPYFEGAVYMVKCAAWFGSVMLGISAIWNFLDGEMMMGILGTLCAVLCLALGVQGVRRKEQSYLIGFSIVSIIAAMYAFVGIMICSILIQALHQQSAHDVERNFGASKPTLMTFYALEGFFSLSFTLFWMIAAYSSYRLVKLIETRREQAVRRHQMSIIRDTIEAAVVHVRLDAETSSGAVA